MRRLGIDIGGTKTLCVVVDDVDGEARVVEERRVATDAAGDAAAAVVTLARGFDGITSVGLGIAALVTRDGTAVTTTHLPRVRDVPLRAVLSERLGLPVVVDNDGTCATVAEWRLGSARGHDEVLVVTIGTGIGGGTIVGGRVARGTNGFAGEFGHMVVERGGAVCPCGRRGCWETYVSGRGLARIAGAASSEAVLEACARGEESAVRALEEFADWAALGLHNLVNTFDPACIVLGGGLGARSEVVAAITGRFRGVEQSHVGRAMPVIAAATLGERAGAIGAAFVGAGD
ncbi:MAG: ROK family protein [Actinobacteria bacterium]|nr:ROK family protein [Actinomycetota bacterium]